MGRSSDAPQQLIESARRLMHDRGYSTIGVAEICDTANVKKGSFYYFFPSKLALTIAALRANWSTERVRWVELLSERDALRSLEALFREQARIQQDHHLSTGSVVGCLYGNLALETHHTDVELRDCLREIFDDQSQLVLGALSRAADSRSLGASMATIDTARALIAQLEGAVLLAKLYDDPSMLIGLWPQMTRLLGVPRS